MLSAEVQKIRDKMQTQGWPKYLQGINIDGLHGFKKLNLNISFPVCAIVGENGTGKSTILKLCACAYKYPSGTSYFPSDFFPNTAWEKIQGTNINYNLVLGGRLVIKSIRKPTQRWRGLTERIENKVYYLDLGRILPFESSVGYSKMAKEAIKEISSRSLTDDDVSVISEIMARNYLNARLVKTDADDVKEVGLLNFDFGEVSQFHMGTGESIIFDLIKAVEEIPDNSLIIIDEVESSLHPKAQRRLIKQLLKLARVKCLQIIISTHSPYILSELPPDARILLTRTNTGIGVAYGPSVEFCLSCIDEGIHSELDILVEDHISKEIVREILRTFNGNTLTRVNVIPVGPVNVLKTLSDLGEAGTLPYKIHCITDADQTISGIHALPGNEAPEKQIIKDISLSHSEKLASFMNVDPEEMKMILREIQTISDYHTWPRKLSERLNILTDTLWSYMVNLWVKNCLSTPDGKAFINEIERKL